MNNEKVTNQQQYKVVGSWLYGHLKCKCVMVNFIQVVIAWWNTVC